MAPVIPAAPKAGPEASIAYHRALDGGIQKLPYEYFVARREVFEHAGAFTAYRIRGQAVAPIMVLKKKDQDFQNYATAWEKQFSKVIQRNFVLDPVVDENMLVIGHLGWVGAGDISVPKGARQAVKEKMAAEKVAKENAWVSPADQLSAVLRQRATLLPEVTPPKPFDNSIELNNLLSHDVNMVVATQYSASYPSDFEPTGVNDVQHYLVMTDVDGHIVAIMGYRESENITSNTFQPQDLILVPLLAERAVAMGARAAMALEDFAAASNGARGLIWTLARRGSARVAGGLSRAISTVFRRTTAVTEEMIVSEEIDLTTNAAYQRALKTQLNLQDKVLKRTLTVLNKPTVFRHTITSDVPYANFARIQRDKVLTLSSGAKAHYGEGVYAWAEGKLGAGARYIDIRVPSGTAAELLETSEGSWYRLVPANGNKLTVEVVSHNFNPQEVKMGETLIKGD